MGLQIKGKTIGIKFNNYAIEQMPGIKGDAKGAMSNGCLFIWCGYLGWCFAKQIDPEITFEDVVDYVDGSLSDNTVVEKLSEVISSYKDSQFYLTLMKKKAEAEPEDTDEKKSTTGTTSTPTTGDKSELTQENTISLAPTKHGASQKVTKRKSVKAGK